MNTVQIRKKMNPLFKISLVLFVASSVVPALAQTEAVRTEAPTVKVGDTWKFETRDRRTGLKESDSLRTVTSISASQIEGTDNDGKFVALPGMNYIETSTFVLSGDLKQLIFPMELGTKWDYKQKYTNKATSVVVRTQADVHVTAYEKIKVAAGDFDAFKIEHKGYWNNDSSRRNGRFTRISWYAPSAKSIVKTEYEDGFNNTVTELLELRLQP